MIKAKTDLIWKSGLTVPKGTFGTLKECILVVTKGINDSNDTAKWMVQWWNGVVFGRDDDDAVRSRHTELTTAAVAPEYIEKCHPSKYWSMF